MSLKDMVFRGIDDFLMSGSVEVPAVLTVANECDVYCDDDPTKEYNHKYSSRVWRMGDYGKWEQPFIHRALNLGHSVARLDSFLLRTDSVKPRASLFDKYDIYKEEFRRFGVLMEKDPNFGILARKVDSSIIETSIVKWKFNPNFLSFYGHEFDYSVASVRAKGFGDGVLVLDEHFSFQKK